MQLNKLLARGDDELALFEEEDARLAAAELAAWRGFTTKSKTAKSTTAVAAVAGGMEYSRLASESEVAPMVTAAREALAPKDPDKGKEFGRGKRARTTLAASER